MKKIYLLLPLVSLLLGCSSESMQSDENFETLSLEAEVEFPGMDLMGVVSWDLIHIQSGNSKGTAYIGNDCENLYVLIQGAEEGTLGLYNEGEVFPKINKNNGHVPPNLEYPLDVQPLMWTFALTDFPSNGVNIFLNAGGPSWGGDLSWGNAKYFYYEFQVDNCGAGVCPYGLGFWKNHSSENPGEQDNDWPVIELNLGNHTYDQEDLNAIMDASNNGSNNLVILSQHLIAAKLNVANGAGNSEIAATIEDADDLIGSLIILEDSFSKENKEEANGLKVILEEYNESSPCADE